MISKWFLFCQQKTALSRLICFPYAGGAAGVYASWLQFMPESVELLAVQYPGRATRINEPPIGDSRVLVKGIAQAILELPRMPTALFGHSMGGRLAYEVMVLLSEVYGLKLDLLVASAAPAPHKELDENSLLFKRELDRGGIPIYLLENDAFIEEVRVIGGTPDLVLSSEELMDMVIPSLRADFALSQYLREHRVEKSLACPIVTLSGEQDLIVSSELIASWADLTTSEYRNYSLKGNHFFLHSDKQLVMRILRKELAELIGV